MVGVPLMVLWVMVGIFTYPEIVCLYVHDSNLTVCSFGIIRSNHEDIYISNPDPVIKEKDVVYETSV